MDKDTIKSILLKNQERIPQIPLVRRDVRFEPMGNTIANYWQSFVYLFNAKSPTFVGLEIFTFIWYCIAVRTRLELVTPCVTGMYSNQTELTHLLIKNHLPSIEK